MALSVLGSFRSEALLGLLPPPPAVGRALDPQLRPGTHSRHSPSPAGGRVWGALPLCGLFPCPQMDVLLATGATGRAEQAGLGPGLWGERQRRVKVGLYPQGAEGRGGAPGSPERLSGCTGQIRSLPQAPLTLSQPHFQLVPIQPPTLGPRSGKGCVELILPWLLTSPSLPTQITTSHPCGLF